MINRFQIYMQLIGFANIFYFFSAGGKNWMKECLFSGGCNRLESLGLCDGREFGS